MINQQLVNPRSIVVVGGSNDTMKPGGSSLWNILNGSFSGNLFIVNARENIVQGIKCYHHVSEIPNADLAIISIPARSCVETIDILANQKGVKAFIVYSAGFGEETVEGAKLERKILKIITDAGACMLGPNCSGMFNIHHQSLFTQPIPLIDPSGVDMVSSSGGTASFIIESSMHIGLRFNSVWSVGNASQNGVEDIVEYLDESFDAATSSRIKLFYIENIHDPDKLLRHSSSLIRKGCRIAAIKSGTTESGSRAAASHTGAIANSDLAVEALFRKAGIIRCYSREELANVGAVLSLKPLKGKNLAIISHAGGPAVILTDALSKANIHVPEMPREIAEGLKAKLLPGSSVSNPIDLLGTGTGEHLGLAIDYCIEHFKEIDGIAVIYGNPGVTKVVEAYDILDKKIKTSPIPIYPILPSVVMAVEATSDFVKKGHVNFADEVVLATALSKVVSAAPPSSTSSIIPEIDIPAIRQIIHNNENGWLKPQQVRELLTMAGIPVVEQFVSTSKEEIVAAAEKIGFPVVLKVVGPIHKSDVGGVRININSPEYLARETERMMQIPGATSVMIQPMLKGKELFIGAKYEPGFGHVLLCGLGGIFVEVLKDVASGLAPLNFEEAYSMVRSLRAYKIIQGTRGQEGVDEDKFVEIIVRLSILLRYATEIKELDINPLMATQKEVIAVDSRMYIEK
jgi:acetyltransferase